MARRRMFTVEFLDSDRFMDLQISAQMLYINLSIHADDEGFLSSAKRLSAPYGGVAQLEALEKAGFIIRFPSGVVAIVDWYLNNTIRKDRSAATIHQTERKQLTVRDGRYVISEKETCENRLLTFWDPDDNQMTTTCQPNDNQLTTNCQPSDNQLTTNRQPSDNQLTTNCQPFGNHLATQNRIEQNRTEQNISEQNISEDNRIEAFIPEQAVGENADILAGDLEEDTSIIGKEPTCMDIYLYCQEKGLTQVDAMQFWSHYFRQKWKDKDGKPIKDWKALVKSWNDSRSSA